ncbi:MAG TPA: type IV toxin-antitoxin system AbiEi family antitoxin domain-containing protein [Solirubrobacterales bacterium]|nr:type IV toxin-antitoxin system AbiEi family antitoxin domain-containing protein [Solirubrobacterales bacterium]
MAREAWALAENQHGVVSNDQLREVGYTPQAIYHRIRTGRLHPLHRGVYVVGRPQATAHGRWMAAVLACPGSVLSHSSAAALWRMGPEERDQVQLSLPSRSRRSRPGLEIHQRPSLHQRDITREYGIPCTTPVQTLIDMSLPLDRAGVERMINEADKYNLVHPPQLREALAERAGEPGAAKLRFILDRRTFRLTKEELERRFLPLARDAGLPTPLTGQFVNDFEVDFHWPDLGLVIETDGLRYHRTPAEQARDRLRDQAHTAAGLTPLRFTHEQVRYEPDHVLAVLRAIAGRLAARAYQLAAEAPSPLMRAAIATK